MEQPGRAHDHHPWQTAGMGAWGRSGSPFYHALCEGLAVDVERDGPASRVLAPFGGAPPEAAYVLRLLGACTDSS